MDRERWINTYWSDGIKVNFDPQLGWNCAWWFTISRNLKPAWLTEGHLVSESQIRVTATGKQTQGHLVGLRDALEISKVHHWACKDYFRGL